MLGATAPADTRELTVSYSSNAARIMIITGLIIFVCSHLHNAFHTQEIDVFLSRPLTRTKLILSYWVGFAYVALIHASAVIILLALAGCGELERLYPVVGWGLYCWNAGW